MLGDVLLITDKHRKAADDIFNQLKTIIKPKMIIAISGESGSGKSELSHCLARLMNKSGIRTKEMHIDNYYRIDPLNRTEWRTKNGIENVVGYDEYDWKTIYRNISEFKNGKEAIMPCVDLVTEQIDKQITNFEKIDAIIIDGLYALKTEGVDFGVFIELTYHETKKAQSSRGKEPDNPYRWAVLEQEHKMVAALKSSAKMFVGMDYATRLAE